DDERSRMTEPVQAAMRPISGGELAFYAEHGWVKLDGLIPRGLAAELLAAAQAIQESFERELAAPSETTSLGAKELHGTRISSVRTPGWVGLYHGQRDCARLASFQIRNIRVDPFHALNFSESLGRTAQQLMNRSRLTDEPVGVRNCEDTIICKGP